MTNNIKIHNQHEFQCMREAGALAAGCLDFINDYIKPGISTFEIDEDSSPVSFGLFPKEDIACEYLSLIHI